MENARGMELLKENDSIEVILIISPEQTFVISSRSAKSRWKKTHLSITVEFLVMSRLSFETFSLATARRLRFQYF